MRTTITAIASVAALILGMFVVAPSASAGESTWEEAYAVYPSDGDTVWVCIVGKRCDLKDKATWTSVRLMSIQAMEIVHNGKISKEAQAAGVPSMKVDQCHGAEAAAALNTLVFGASEWQDPKKSSLKLRLKSEKKASSSYGRLRRTVEVYTGGKWVDVQAELLKQGQVMFMPLPTSLGEDAHNATYSKLAQQAAARKTNLWNPTFCNAGPVDNASLELDVRYDANGDDTKNVNDEFIRIRNTGTERINLKGWSLRTASWQVYDFTKTTYIEPDSRIIVHSGKKPTKASAGHYYFGSSSPFLQNTAGGGAYLFDGDGDLRVNSQYVCVIECATNPGLVITKVVADAKGVDAKNLNGEYVQIKNTSSTPIKLAPYMLKLGSSSLTFHWRAVIAPGKTMTVRIGKGTDTATTKYLKATKPTLSNSRGTVSVITYTGTVITKKSW